MGIDLRFAFKFIAGLIIGFIISACILGYANDRYEQGVKDGMSGKYKVDTTVNYTPVK